MYLTMGMAINVNNKWFLPFQQYPFVQEVDVPMVDHDTRSGHTLKATHYLHKHFVVEYDGVQYTLPAESGIVTDFEIPEEYVNRYVYREKQHSDNIRDYIKAAAKYLNIEIRYQIEFAGWYKTVPRPKMKKVGAPTPKEVQEDKTRDKTLN